MVLVLTRVAPRVLAKAMSPDEQAVAAIYGDAVDALGSDMNGEAMRQALATGNPSAAVAAVSWDGFAATVGTMAQTFSKAAANAANLPSNLRIVGAFDRTDPRAFAFAQRQAATLVRDVTEETRAMIRATVTDAFASGVTPQDTARRLSTFVGLTERQTLSVGLAQGKELERLLGTGMDRLTAEAKSFEHAARVQDRMVKTRAKTIARTEISRAQMSGRYLSWAQAVEAGTVSPESRKQWLADGSNPCEICAPYDDEVVMWDESFSNGVEMPPAHPNCLCSAVLMPPETELTNAPTDAPDANINAMEPDIEPLAPGEAFKQKVDQQIAELNIPKGSDRFALDAAGNPTKMPSQAMNAAEEQVRAIGQTVDGEIERRMRDAGTWTGDLPDPTVLQQKAFAMQKESTERYLASRDAWLREVEGYKGDFFDWRNDPFSRQRFPTLTDVEDAVRAFDPQIRIALDETADAFAEFERVKAAIRQGSTDYADTMREVLGEVRSMGLPADGVNFAKNDTVMRGLGLRNDIAKAGDNLAWRRGANEALDFYPTEWIEASNQAGPVYTRSFTSSKRGWQYSDPNGNGFVHIPTSRVNDRGLMVHEWGHRMEATNPDVTSMEWTFWHRRAAGETPSKLSTLTGNSGYSASEIAVKDAIKEPYALKIYQNNPDHEWEILTMGHEGIHTGKFGVSQDKDFLWFILGMLGGV